jgi:hypothetical protein
MTKGFAFAIRLGLAGVIFFALGGSGQGHSGMVDGYGCHRGADKTSYHCHQGQFVGRTFKSREDFLRQLRSGKSEQLSPKNNPPLQPEKKSDD